jgi:hypothetical protein
VTAHHQIDFPITDSSFFIDDSGTIINRNSVGDRAFMRGFERNSLGVLLLVKVGMKSATAVSIPTDMLVDSLMGYREGFVSSEPAGNLPGAPLVTQFAFDYTATASSPLKWTTTVCPSFFDCVDERLEDNIRWGFGFVLIRVGPWPTLCNADISYL